MNKNLLKTVSAIFLSHLVCLCFAQTQCSNYLQTGPLDRTTGYGEEQIAPGLYQGLAQRYNNLSGSLNAIKFWARANSVTTTVKVIVYNEQQGSGLPGVILGQTTASVPAGSSMTEIIATLPNPVNLTSPNVTIISIEYFFTTDNFFVQHNKAGNNNTATPGDGQGLWLNLAKQANTWYKNLANGDFEWDYDFLILPMTSAAITSNFTNSANGLSVTFTNTSTGASSYLREIKNYEQYLATRNRKILNDFVAAYQVLHLSGSYDGVLKKSIIEEGLELAENIIEWCEKN